MSHRPYFLRPGPFDSVINFCNKAFAKVSDLITPNEKAQPHTEQGVAPRDLAERPPENRCN